MFPPLSHNQCPWYTATDSGYVTLLSMLLVGAVGGTIVLSLLLAGLGFSQTSRSEVQSAQAQSLASACAEDALESMRENVFFSGTTALTLGAGSCNATTTSQGGENRTIVSTGTVGTVVRKVKVIVTRIVPSIQLSSWQEVADF